MSVTIGGSIPTPEQGAAVRNAFGLGNVDDTSDEDKPISAATAAALAGKETAGTAAAAMAAHEAALDPHPQYATAAEASAAAAAAVNAHTTEPDPHTQYTTAAEAAAAAPVQSVAGKTGAVTLVSADVGLPNVDDVSAASLRDRATHTGAQAISTVTGLQAALDAKESAGASAAAIAAHTALPDPHSQYIPDTEAASLLNRANHTGTQAIATVSGLQAALDGKLEKLLPQRTVTTDTTITAADHTVRCDCASGGIRVSLPAASTVSGQIFVIKKVSRRFLVIVDPNGTELIDGGLTAKLKALGESITIQSNGTSWDII